MLPELGASGQADSLQHNIGLDTPGCSGAGRELQVFDRGGKFFVSVDRAELGPYDGVGNKIEFSEDGRRVLYRAELGGKHFIVLDGVAGKRYDRIEENSYKLSPDGRRTAFVATDFGRFGQKEFAVVDGNEGKPFDSVQGLTFGPGGRRVRRLRRPDLRCRRPRRGAGRGRD